MPTPVNSGAKLESRTISAENLNQMPNVMALVPLGKSLSNGKTPYWVAPSSDKTSPFTLVGEPYQTMAELLTPPGGSELEHVVVVMVVVVVVVVSLEVAVLVGVVL